MVSPKNEYDRPTFMKWVLKYDVFPVPFHHSHEYLHTGARDHDLRLHLLIKEVIKEVTAHTQALLWDNLEFIILPKATLTPLILHSSISSLGTLHDHLYVEQILKLDVETGFKK